MPKVFDRSLMRGRLTRALGRPQAGADFLLERAARELDERLQPVKRDFAVSVDIGTPGPHVALALADNPRVGAVFRMAPVLAALGNGAFGGLVGDEETLPFRPESLNLAVSALALQHVNDLPGALTQIRRALKPDGLFLGCLLGGQSLHELRTALAAAEAEIDGGASPRVAPFADVRDAGGLLQRAEFALPVADTDRLIVRYRDLFGLLDDLRAMGATNALAQRRRTPIKRAVLRRAAEVYAERFSDADGRVRATFDMVWLSGWAPHESQQQPLKPGSATARLAEALGVKEIDSGEKPAI